MYTIFKRICSRHNKLITIYFPYLQQIVYVLDLVSGVGFRVNHEHTVFYFSTTQNECHNMFISPRQWIDIFVYRWFYSGFHQTSNLIEIPRPHVRRGVILTSWNFLVSIIASYPCDELSRIFNEKCVVRTSYITKSNFSVVSSDQMMKSTAACTIWCYCSLFESIFHFVCNPFSILLQFR